MLADEELQLKEIYSIRAFPKHCFLLHRLTCSNNNQICWNIPSGYHT